MNCPNCNGEAPDGAAFCPVCGAALPAAGEPGAPSVPGTPPEQAPPGGQAPAGPGAQAPPPGKVTPSGTGFKAPPPGVYPAAGAVRNNPLCVAALVLGIASMVFFWGPFLGLVLAIAGIVLGRIGMDQVDERPQDFTGRNLGQVGFILSIVGGVLNVIVHFVLWFRWWW